MINCKKCNKEFEPVKGLLNFCSLACRNSREQTLEIRIKKSESAKINHKNPIKGKFGKNNPKWIPRVFTKCLMCEKDIEHPISKERKYHNECWLKNSGGYRQGSSRGKCGRYKGYWCDSSYELVWVIYQLDHCIPFERNKQRFEYIWNNKKHEYIPDFIQNDTIIEIKGFLTLQVEEKIKSVPGLKVLFKKDLSKEFEYVKNKYGKDFIKLYEK
jgi:hypothetical protein